MTFPLLELKIAQIRHETAEPRTSVLVRLYRVDDGGIVNGVQQYQRTLRASRWMKERGVLATNAQILKAARLRLQALADEFGVTLPPDRVRCSL